MSNPQPRRLNSLFGTRAPKERRPSGVSRKRKKQLGFESLETRQVMSANPIVQPTYSGGLSIQTQSYSSNTLEGYLAQLQREIAWADYQSGNGSAAALNTVESIPTDPYVANQWHLINSGQSVGNPDWQPIYGVAGEDINVAPVWNMGYTGAGVVVGVVDSGVVLNHPDLAANIHPTLGRDVLSGDNDPSPNLIDPTNAHGTAVAGIIGAVANNGIGGAGVAPGVSLVPIRFLGGIPTPQTELTYVVDMLQYGLINGIDIYNHSWGSALGRTTNNNLDGAVLEALRDTIRWGRNELGMIHVKSSGNSGGPVFSAGFPSAGVYSQSNYEAWDVSRYVINVTGVDHDGFYNNFDGTVTAYPEAGANVLIAAPTGSNAPYNIIGTDTGLGSGIWTTDALGEDGFNVGPNPQSGFEYDRDFLDDTDYTSRFNGTSAAAPMVTGVVALMLEANPNLSWRDVQEILVRSARQNAALEVPANGAGVETQNMWIVNQMPVFSDPDPYQPGVGAFLQTFSPTLDANIVFDPITGSPVQHYAPTASVMTNGAGYTVSLGRGVYGELIGSSHGVVDAEMAVQLAEQWHTKGQNLPPQTERTFNTFFTGAGLNLPAAEQLPQENGAQLIPGALGGRGGFSAFWNEYFADDPFSQDNPPDNTRGSFIEFSVPDNNAMTVETVEVKVDISGPAADLDHLRILLVSPTGTFSELNDFNVDPAFLPYSLNNLTPYTTTGDPGGDLDADGGSFVWTFSTNRSWGESSADALVYDPTTGEPVTVGGVPLTQGWRLYIENYSNASFVLEGAEVIWHGNPIQAETQRIQGFVGIDENRDDLFHYDRIDVTVLGDRLGDVITTIDQNQEAFAGNITVVARRASDGVVVDRFVTGHDGNYYFDLVPDDYIISIEDPLGRVAQDDSVTASGLLDHFKSEWLITEDYFRVWDRDAVNVEEVLTDANGDPLTLAGFESAAENVRNINFLLDPGAPPAAQVVFSGVVYADTNLNVQGEPAGDGVFNNVDVVLANISVFGDVNRNGQLDAGEIIVKTDANGAYNLVVPLQVAGVMNVGVVLPTLWDAVTPAGGVHTRFVTLGDEFTGLDFFIEASAPTIVGSGSLPGILLGSVFNDVDADGVRDAGELGAPGFTVYIDANNNSVLDFGDTQTTTNQFGAYAFTNVAPGQRFVRIVAPSPFQTTTPTSGRWTANLTGGGTISLLVFGLKDTAVLDYGDLPNIYGATTLAQDGARHAKGPYWLGTRVDGELNGNPTANADGDDLAGFDDDDGIVFDPIVPGSTVRLVATASLNGGFLKGWIDWNGDGDFDDANERIVFSGVAGVTNNYRLSKGANEVSFDVPAGVSVANVYARFRYAESPIDSIYGAALIGEVEDYLLPVAPPAIPAIQGLAADFTGDDRVDGADFLTWQRNFGKTTGAGQAQGSTNGDGDVDGYDLEEWQESFGTAISVAALTTEDDFSEAPQTLAVEFQTVSTIAAAANDTFSSSLRSTGASLSLNSVVPATVDEATSRFESRPNLAALAGKLTDVADRLRQRADSLDDRLDEGRDFVVELLHDVADRVDNFDFESVRRDRAFDDLFGSRRRQGLKAEVEAEAGEETDADEAFAMFADHFEVPRG